MARPPFDPGRRRALRHLATAAMGFAAASARLRAAEADVPVTGEAREEFQPFDELMTSFLARHEVPGAALAVTKDSRLVYARGFGYADRERKIPVQPDALFRIASVSKPLTAAAVMQLVEQRKFSLDDRFLDLYPLEPEQLPRPDARVREITVRNLLQQASGWDRDKSGDPIGRPRDVCSLLGVAPPPGPVDIIRYTLCRPLDFAPGERYAYSNVTYLCLGRLIEKFSGQPYETAVQAAVLQPLGIRRMQVGYAEEDRRLDGEVRYYDRMNRRVPSLADPQREVPLQYGGENFRNYEAHGGWVASAIDLVRFASAFDRPERCPLLSPATIETMWARPAGLLGADEQGQPRDAYYACGWNVRPVGNRGRNTWHGGLIAGTSTILVRRWDGLTWTVLFNTDRTTGQPARPLSGVIDPLVHAAAEAVRTWPDHDLFTRYGIG
jgi:N-acyl-D-amino-acid deacylase